MPYQRRQSPVNDTTIIKRDVLEMQIAVIYVMRVDGRLWAFVGCRTGWRDIFANVCC